MNKQYLQLVEFLKGKSQGICAGVLCNQTAFDFDSGLYLPEIISPLFDHLKLLIPEHGFFAEQQDQASIQPVNYFPGLHNIDYISLYRNEQNKLGDLDELLKGMDVLVIDIQDVGSRYFTYIATIGHIVESLVKTGKKMEVIVIDHPNPAGRTVEGTLLSEEYSSLIGWPGIPHRYGLTIGELCLYIQRKLAGSLDLKIIKCKSPVWCETDLFINPSPNIPSLQTAKIYAGQCLLEGTNLSEGRGTTRPFEIFGAPFLSLLNSTWLHEWNRENPEVVLQPLQFIPTFHKYVNQPCDGFQMHVVSKAYHSLLYSLKLLRSLANELSEFTFPDGPYEYGSVKPAIELLAGDALLLKYVYGNSTTDAVKACLLQNEKAWIKEATPFLLYESPLVSTGFLT